MTPAAILAALPPEARKYLSRYIDPAEAFISWNDGLTQKQARSRARNRARPLGSSWPDRAPVVSLHDLDLHGENQDGPLEILLAREAAAAALASRDAAHRLAICAAGEIDTARLASVSKITKRRAQQLKAQRLALAQAGQGVLI